MSVADLTLIETLPIETMPFRGDATEGLHIHAEPSVTVRVRRDLGSAPGRRWLLELEITVRVPDPEEVLANCEDFVVDTLEGKELGIVDEVKMADEDGLVSALVVGGSWFGRPRFRVEADDIAVLIPADERLIVRQPPEGFRTLERRA
jgi:sporulation protein YlmC with PRC-barrel domain